MSEQPTTEQVFSKLVEWATPQVREALTVASRSLGTAFAAAGGRLGTLDREWGFMTPGGLGPAKAGPLDPYRSALERAHSFFAPAEAVHRVFGRADGQEIAATQAPGSLQAWQLPGNIALQAFLEEAPGDAGTLPATALRSYREGAGAFILLATLAHTASKVGKCATNGA